MKKFEDFPLVRGHCQHCRNYGDFPPKGIRQSPETGDWCEKHWYEGPRCSEPGCNEPLMRIKDGGDGNKCRAHIFPDKVTDEERQIALSGRHPLAALGSKNHRGEYLNAAESKQATSVMREMGIPGVNFYDQSILAREGD